MTSPAVLESSDTDDSTGTNGMAAREQMHAYETGAASSREAFEQAAAVMPGGPKGAYYFAPFPLYFERGEGARLQDLDGSTYLDCANHHTSQVLGHSHPAVRDAVDAQLNRGIVLGGPTGAETALARELCDRVESLDRVRFCNSGTEATLHAVRLARAASGKSLIAKFEGGYHGSHDAVEISVAPPVDQAGDPGAPSAVAGVAGQSPSATEEILVLPYDDVDAATRLIETHADRLACILLDPKTGILASPSELAGAVSETAARCGVLLIVDEVVAFRLGRGGWQEQAGITPDLTTYGKLVGGGFPIGAFGGRADLMDRLDMTRGASGSHQSGTFSAHPVAMAAGLATLQALTPDAFGHLDALGGRLEQGLASMNSARESGFSWVVSGSLFSLYFADQPPRGYRDLAMCRRESNGRLFHHLLKRGYYLSHSLGMNALSLPMTMADVDGLVDAIDQGLEALRAE